MTTRSSTLTKQALARVVSFLTIACALIVPAMAQTAADTPIQNQASATYSDGNGGSYSTISNTVTITVAKVSGLAITPDAQVDPTVVPGQTGLLFAFTVRNTGNFSDQVRFLSGGASTYLGGTSPGVITRAVIDVDNSGGINAGDTDIKTNGGDVLSASIAQNAAISVLVEVSVNSGATAGQVVQVFLGDASTGSPTFDNQTPGNLVTPSTNEVRTVSSASVNGVREARGDRSVTVALDAQLVLGLTGPAGPVPLGSNITYVWNLCNTGARAATSVTLTNAPVANRTNVFIIAPIPAGTNLAGIPPNSFPTGTLYSTSPLAQNPITTATWTVGTPASFPAVTRVAIPVGSSLAAGACSANFNMIVTIVTTDATNAITEQGVAYGTNTINTQITATSPTVITLLTQVGNVLNGPQGAANAVGPTNNNDDYTNKSTQLGIAGIAPGGVTTAASGVMSFTNTVQNTGNANDNYTLSLVSFPSGATVVLNGVLVVNNGTPTGTAVPAIPIAFGATANYTVTVNLPASKTVLTGYDTVIRATSGITSSATNDTIDRVYTGFVRITKAYTVANSTLVGGPTDAVPGAVITFAITYTNVASTGGTGNVTLNATTVVITENGSTSPNNWATYTDHVVGAACTMSGTITGDTVGSNVLTDTVASLLAGQSGVFTFKRQIK